MEIITKREAIEQGLKRYFTGKPCKWGHVAERFVICRGCIECKKKHGRQYHLDNKEGISEKKKQYRLENKEMIHDQNKRWWQKNKDMQSERLKKWRLENKEKVKEYSREYKKKYIQDNKDNISEYKKRYYKENRNLILAKVIRYRENNAEKIKDMKKEYYKKNPFSNFIRYSLGRIENGTGINSKRSMKQIESDIGYTQECFKGHIESLWLDGMSWDNRIEWHIDHIIPINQFIKNGIEDIKIINSLDNLQPLWASENMEKSGTNVPKKQFNEFLKLHSTAN